MPESSGSGFPSKQPNVIQARDPAVVGDGNETHNDDSLAKLTDFSNHRDKAEAQARNLAMLKLSNKTRALQQDGGMCETSDLHGAETMEPLSHEFMIHVNHCRVPKIWRSWLRNYHLCSTSQIGVLCDVTELEHISSVLKEMEIW